jgi:hypothetical protein
MTLAILTKGDAATCYSIDNCLDAFVITMCSSFVSLGPCGSSDSLLTSSMHEAGIHAPCHDKDSSIPVSLRESLHLLLIDSKQAGNA